MLINSEFSDPLVFESRVPQAVVPWLVLFRIYVNDFSYAPQSCFTEYYWMILNFAFLFQLKAGLRQNFFWDRECPLNESEINPPSSIKRSVGTLMSISKISVPVFYFGIYLFDCWGYVVGSIYRLDRVLKFLYTKLNLSMFLFEPPENLTYFDPLKMNIKNPKVITKT